MNSQPSAVLRRVVDALKKEQGTSDVTVDESTKPVTLRVRFEQRRGSNQLNTPHGSQVGVRGEAGELTISRIGKL